MRSTITPFGRVPMRFPAALRAPRPARDALLFTALLGLSLSACEDETPPPIVRTLDGPADMAFTCWGSMRETQGQAPAESQEIVTSPMPLEACRGWHEVSVDVDDKDNDDPTDDERTLVVAPPAGQGPIGLQAGASLTEAQSDELFEEWQAGASLTEAQSDELFEEWQAEVKLYGFALQRNQGSVAVISQRLGATPTVSLIDADPFAPGRNVIPVGTQPVGIATDPSGCHVMTANAGSCDLSWLEVGPVLTGTAVAEVHTTPVSNAAGEPLAVKPRAIVAQAPSASAPVGFTCDESPDSLVYVAYPDCHAVAAVHAATGEIRASIVFAEDGSVVLGDGNLSCGATTCGGLTTPPVVEAPDAGPVDAGVPDAGAPDAGAPDAGVAVAAVGGRPRPVALHMASDGARLYIGAENSPQVAIVDLGPDALPTAAQSVALDCEQDPRTRQCVTDVGVTALAATGPIPMGGELGRADEGPFGEFRFVYAAATDNTVRVVEVGSLLRECDTQIDARYLHEVRDGQLLACLPVGDPALPRRVSARSPGIHMPGQGRPLDIVFVQAPGIETFTEEQRPPIAPSNLIGHFAFISLTNGNVVVVNVDDDNYGDVESTTVPVEVDMSLALPHQLRDAGNARRSSLYCALAGGDDDDDDDDTGYQPLVCDFSSLDSCGFPSGAAAGAPAMTVGSVITKDVGNVAEDYLGAMPELRNLECVTAATEEDPATSSGVPELSRMVPDPLRESVMPDLQSVRNETWNIVWEGLLSRQNAGALDPSVRLGYVELDGELSLRDGGAPFCEMGAQPGDVVTLRGCDPELGNQHCQAAEVCAVLPDIDIASQLGICVPAGSEDLAKGTCLGFFNSRRRFLVEQSFAGRLVLGERKRILRTTPVAGCSSDTQCAALYDLEQDLAAGEALEAQSPQSTNRWACEPEPVSNSARNVCVMMCASDADCEVDWQCSGDGYCVEAVLPPAECVKTLQRYDVRAGNAFTVIGSVTGFLHDLVADSVTGECVADPTAHPLAQSRVPLTVPPCTGEGYLDVAPNPCATTVSHFENEKGERQAPAIRVRNPAFVIHLVDAVFDPATQGIACSLDGAACPPMTAVPPGYVITFTIAGGFAPLNAVSELRFPIGLANDPLGSIWIMDQGDSSSAVRGQVARISPLALEVTAVVQ